MRASWVLVLVAACSSSQPQPQPQPHHTESVDDQLSKELAGIHGADAQPPDADPLPVRAPDPEPTACPATLADAQGQCIAGKINRKCPYPPSTVCSCKRNPPPCSPVNHDNDPPVWVCEGPPPPPVPPKPRTDGCPDAMPKGACSKPKQACSYRTGCCWENFVCTDGAWTHYTACPK
jgi:hypothetical protein